jgi:hypothetical protein
VTETRRRARRCPPKRRDAPPEGPANGRCPSSVCVISLSPLCLCEVRPGGAPHDSAGSKEKYDRERARAIAPADVCAVGPASPDRGRPRCSRSRRSSAVRPGPRRWARPAASSCSARRTRASASSPSDHVAAPADTLIVTACSSRTTAGRRRPRAGARRASRRRPRPCRARRRAARPAPAARRVLLAQLAAHAGGDCLEDGVAGGVAALGVDVADAVDSPAGRPTARARAAGCG